MDKSKWKKSLENYQRAQASLAGGVSSPFRGKLPVPLYFRNGRGPLIEDVDGNSYLDHVLAWGPLILGHKHPVIVQALQRSADLPHNYGAQHELEFLVSERMCQLIPCAERVALTSTGSEAVQLAMRLARAFTGRTLILKFEGHYHGWMDSTLLSYHPSREQMGSERRPNVALGSVGQVPNAAENVIVLPWNDVTAVGELFDTRGADIAAVITEPVLCNSGCLMPLPGFLQELRRITRHHGALLIFDEVITGFRMALGGAQAVFGVLPDLASFGKALGAGLPVSSVAGRKDILDLVSNGTVAFGGTFNGNCICLAAAYATLEELTRDGGQPLRDGIQQGERLMHGIEDFGDRAGVPVRTTGFGTAFSVHFTNRSVLSNYRDTLDDDRQMLQLWLFECLKEGIYLLPDGRVYTSVVHRPQDIDRALTAFQRVFTGHLAKHSAAAEARV